MIKEIDIDKNISKTAIAESNIARLVFIDGSIYYGEILGATGIAVGEALFTTAMTGYQEVISDPSYYGQIVIFTFPEIGVTSPFLNSQSDSIYLAGMVVAKNNSIELNGSLIKHNVVGIKNIDTRAVSNKLRQTGNLLAGIFSNTTLTEEEMVLYLILNQDKYNRDICKDISKDRVEVYNIDGVDTIIVIDYGIKRNILDIILSGSMRVVILPYDCSLYDILLYNPTKIILSNGPGNPEYLVESVNTIRELIKREIPILGICLGAELILLSLNYKLKKLKFGHHSNSHPVFDVINNKVLITTHNHGFALDEGSLDNEIKILFKSLNDDTIEGFSYKNCIGIQFHPEGGGGCKDALYILKRFVNNNF
jgi:carbamoyl-phosphate synthase small subunit